MNASPGGGPPRRVWRKVNGVLLLDKPLGLSSNQALQAARRLYRADKGGHTGTLDPLATGLLPICFGEATKFSGELLSADKRYTARIRLGIKTDTADAEGAILSERPVNVTLAEFEEVLSSFRGAINQVPPMYSALKRDGKPLYEYARSGVDVERVARQVTIFEAVITDFRLPIVEVDVFCSKGTYIRTLAEDIGERLGCGAHLAALRRTSIGWLDIAAAITLTTVEAAPEINRDELLEGADALLLPLPSANLSAMQADAVMHGRTIDWYGESGRYRIYGEASQFLGVCRAHDDRRLAPERLIATA